MKKTYLYSFAALVIVASLASCKTKSAKSEKTGLAYNKKEYGGFQVNHKYKRGPGPGLVEIEGGVFVMSGSAINVPGQELSDYNHKRETTVSSFYMDETEVSNTNWLEYLNWIRTNYPTDYEYYYNELPDTLVWRRPLSYNEPYVNNYLRHPAYQDYPVVGVTWEQADRYCRWRTDRVNELLLREKGYMTTFKDMNGTTTAATTTTARPKEPFNTDIYLNGQYDDKGKRAMKDLNPSKTAEPGATAGKAGVTRNVRLEDGILKQPYRLPTEAEWEYAALGLIGNTQYENIAENKIYPWNGLGLSSAKKKTRGLILANFKRSKGDYMGVGGSLNDKGGLTVAVRSYMPNDFGLYNMAGNVNEWVADVYRSKTFEAADAFNPYRGNFYQDKKMADAATGKIEKDKYNMPVMVAAVSARKQTWAEKQAAANNPAADSLASKNTYADQRGYRDPANELYGETTLINDKSRVYKGGSWEDQAVWLNPATRRFLQQDESTADIGFRCAMTMLGASEIRSSGKPQFKPKPPRGFKSR